MPVAFIEAPPGIQDEAKRRLIWCITSAIDDVHHTLIFLREYALGNVAMDGKLQSENAKILETLRKITSGSKSGMSLP